MEDLPPYEMVSSAFMIKIEGLNDVNDVKILPPPPTLLAELQFLRNRIFKKYTMAIELAIVVVLYYCLIMGLFTTLAGQN